MRSRAVGMPSRRSLLLPGLGIIRSRTGSGANCRAFRSSRSRGRNPSSADEDRLRPQPVDPRRPLPSVAPDPGPRHHEDGRVTDEVEQVVEPAIRIIDRPLMQLGLDPQYPRLGQLTRPATARRYSPAISHPSSPFVANSLPPFAM